MSTGEQKFCVSVAKDAQYTGGLRDFLEYRDLGLDAATQGRFGATVVRATKPCTGGTGPHFHVLDFQFAIVLKGWVEISFEGQGTFRFNVGDSVLVPPGTKHDVLAFSDDYEVLEITSPAKYGTEEA